MSSELSGVGYVFVLLEFLPLFHVLALVTVRVVSLARSALTTAVNG